MLHLTHAIVARAALAVAGTSALVAPAQLNPEPCVRAADAVPAADVPPGLTDLEQLAALERSATDLEGLRGGDANFTTAETVLLVIGVVILAILIF
jgi:hypothetical protein